MTTRPRGLTIVPEPGRVCPVCGGEILAALQVPNGWTTGHGRQVHGTADVLLCSRCDRDDRITGPIVTFFAVHAIATPETFDELAVLLQRWADHAAGRQLDEQALEAEVDAWRRGEL
jgi:hypothetical protein